MINQIQNKIMTMVNSGQLQTARRECLSACKQSPHNAQLWFMLSAICGQMKDFPAAEKYCKKSLRINNTVPSIYYNLAVAQRGQGKKDEAYASLGKAIQLQADFPAALYELGNICLEKQEYDIAISYYQRVIKNSADAFQAYNGMAIAYEKLGNFKAAISENLQSLSINPAQNDVTLRLAGIYDSQNNIDKALQYYNRAIEHGYNQADVYVNLGRMHDLNDNQGEAEKHYKKALLINPDTVEALTNLALIYEKMHNYSTALDTMEKAYQLDPDNEKIIYNYALILSSRSRYNEAEILYRKLLAIKPDFVQASVNLGNIYLLSGKVNEAQEIYSSACDMQPDYNDACSNWLMSTNYSNRYSDTEIRDKHFAWAKEFEKKIQQFPPAMQPYSKASPLKVGFVSSDFRSHSVAYFFEGLLRYSNRQSVINYCYSDVENSDEVTQSIKSYADHWCDITKLDNKTLADRIQKDGIEILVDLNGHTSGNRLAMFALKPAPIQISYLGYPNTTGLSSIDYRIVDEKTDPSGAASFMSETPLYLDPCFLCYTPYEYSPDISGLPAEENAYITFGSFNNLAKMTDEVIDVWSKILQGVPDSKLCIKARQYIDPDIKAEHIKRFDNAGIDVSRLELLSYSNTTAEHLQMYNKIDIALDTFPYNGTTTTFEALWMGVPVVCLIGTRHAGRVGATILNTLGKTELLAENCQQYVKIAIDLANDVNELKQLRGRLRDEMSSSPLLDCKLFASQFEAVLQRIIDKNYSNN